MSLLWQMDRQKAALMDALSKLGMAIAFPYVPSLISPFISLSPPGQLSPSDVAVPPSPPDALLCELDALATTILKLTDPSDVKVSCRPNDAKVSFVASLTLRYAWRLCDVKVSLFPDVMV